MNHSTSSSDQLARRALRLLPEVDQVAVQPVADGAPLVLLDQVRRVDAEGGVVAPHLVELGDDGLHERGDADGLLHPRADVEEAELERGEGVVRAHVPVDLGPVRDAPGADQLVVQVLE
jgi:hypothetical protein